MSSRRRPTQQLNIRCSRCGVVTVRFESWVADGHVFEMVGNKLSEMMAFLSVNNSQVLCTPCSELAITEAEERRRQERERVRQQMELSMGGQSQQIYYQANSSQPAVYDEEGISSLRTRPEVSTVGASASGSGSWPRRGNTQRARAPPNR